MMVSSFSHTCKKDGTVKSRIPRPYVIPAKAGIY